MKTKSNYRYDEKSEYASWWFLVLALVIISLIALGALSHAGRYFDVLIDRQVFEESYQYSESRRAEISTYEAQLAELEVQLEAASDIERSNIEAQIRAINIRLQSVIGEQ